MATLVLKLSEQVRAACDNSINICECEAYGTATIIIGYLDKVFQAPGGNLPRRSASGTDGGVEPMLTSARVRP